MNRYDILRNLPTDKNEIDDKEIEVINLLFEDEEEKTSFNKIIEEFYESFLVGILFIIFNQDYVNNVLLSIVPLLNGSEIFLLLFKTMVFVILFWILKNIRLLNKNDK